MGVASLASIQCLPRNINPNMAILCISFSCVFHNKAHCTHGMCSAVASSPSIWTHLSPSSLAQRALHALVFFQFLVYPTLPATHASYTQPPSVNLVASSSQLLVNSWKTSRALGLSLCVLPLERLSLVTQSEQPHTCLMTLSYSILYLCFCSPCYNLFICFASSISVLLCRPLSSMSVHFNLCCKPRRRAAQCLL